jgi:hypothetical protein
MHMQKCACRHAVICDPERHFSPASTLQLHNASETLPACSQLALLSCSCIQQPRVNLKSGDVSVRVNRALDNGGTLEVNADKRNVDWEFAENAWVVKGNIPLQETGASSISFKRSINLS